MRIRNIIEGIKVKEDEKDDFSQLINPMGQDSNSLKKIKQSPGFHDLIVSMFSSGTQADLEQDEMLHYISKMLNINTVEIKAILQKDGFDFTEPDAETKFKQNMGATGVLGKKDNEKDPQLNSMYSEKAPPGREKQVKKLKKKFDDPGAPYAIAWAQHNKHGKPKK